LKRVAQTASWEEVSEETAREKASQVLRDAVTGLLEKKGGIEDETASIQPLSTLSAPVSVDEYDSSQLSQSTRKPKQGFYPPQPDRLESESKRRRYNAETSDDMYSSSRQQVVGCSPLRRHAKLSYPVERAVDIAYGRSSTYRSDINSRTSTSHTTGQHHLTGNLDEFALLHGELLESDVEEETSLYRDRHYRPL
jgi:hypothetical protein